MNFQVVILLSVAVCALAFPVPDEEVSTLQKAADTVSEAAADAVTSVDELVSSITMEEGANAVVGNATVENLPKSESESELGKPTEGEIETTSVAEDDIKEVPKSLPVMAREEAEAIVPPFAGVRAEPKEGVEIAEAKSTASSPDDDETDSKPETKSTGVIQPITESAVEKKDEASTTEEKPKTDGTSTKPAVAGENKTEDSALPTAETKKSDKTKPKTTELGKHDHSSEGNKSEESAESKESEESDESNKSK